MEINTSPGKSGRKKKGSVVEDEWCGCAEKRKMRII